MYKGGDIEAMRSLASEIQASRSRFERVLAELANELQQLQWQGPDRDRFVAAWEGHAARLRLVCEDLSRAQADVLRRASDQEASSAASGSGGVGAGSQW